MQRRILGLLFAVLFLVMIGFSILFPVEPYYVQTFGATSATMGWLIATFSLAHFVFSPLWGRLSDRIGRKPVMMIGLAGYAAATTLFALARSVPHLFIARGLSGVLSSAALPTAMAVISDTTSEEDRAKGMGLLGAAFGLGAIFGPFVGGILGDVAIRLPFFVTAGLSLGTLLLVWRLLPETLKPEKQKAAAQAASRLKAFQPDTSWLYAVAFLTTFALAGLETAFPFLAYDRLGATTRSVGYLFAAMGLTGSIVQGGLIGPIQKRIGEERMIPLGLFISAAALIWIAVAQSAAAGAAALCLFAAGHGLIRPANVSLITRRTQVGQGLAVGLYDSMDALGRVLGPIAGGTLYVLRDALPFLGAAGIAVLAALIFIGVALPRLRASGEATPS